ncbi:allantoate amidohydrolase [Neobacillus bataviensis]|uniref:allantoate amidohydrolase n=1 Tax=Neobacillus bataviensis TaxID=220685 RepID=UPI001CBB1A31|nr:allantoate amidohydrolase [Neobacillus bataviensis]
MLDLKRKINGQRISQRIDELGRISKSSEGVTRLAFTQEFQEGQKLVEKWMIDAGMTVRVDHLNNIIGRYEGMNREAPAILIGSHLDTVIDGGKYDGMLGVISGIEIVSALSESGYRMENPIEVIGFSDEEGVRFHTTFLGSKAIAGTFKEETLYAMDEKGISLRETLKQLGLKPVRYQEAAYHPNDVLCYLELHIEQGPVLEDLGQPVGVVTGIAGASRYTFKITGFAGHAGTVPILLRKDALIGASEFILEIEKLAKENAPIVATVGMLTVNPGASNVIPGEVTGTLDIRDTDINRKERVIKEIFRTAHEICKKRHLTFEYKKVMETAPVLCDQEMKAAIEAAILLNGMNPISLVSGAGHDAMAMADLTKIGMIFVRCKGGISHNPKEFASVEDMEMGTMVLLESIIQLTSNHKNKIKESIR